MKSEQPKPFLNHEKYRWFFTSSGKLVVGGKSSLQNDELLKKLKRSRQDYIIMHTSTPGSPFAAILSEKKPLKSDIEETAIFTACFSRAWKEKNKQASVDIFTLSKIYKTKSMKIGTWGIKGKIERKVVELNLVLTKQEGRLRAVPQITVKNKDKLLAIRPGKIDKREMLPKFHVLLKEHFSQEELLSALPPGGVTIKGKTKPLKSSAEIPSCVTCDDCPLECPSRK
ncbi:MAG: DUF814 domain-containing protein [Nanoarchaeota archaeon]|nr:DUF814 domain-containing protein [Nanoarchaeota archaeon]